MISSYKAAPDIEVLTSDFPIPGFGLVPINAFVIRGVEPILVDTGAVAAIEASFIARAQSGFVSVTSRLEPGRLAEAEAAILEVVRRIREEGVTPAERERALVTAESFYAFDIETAEGLARSYGQAETAWTLADELAYLDRLRRVTTAEIQAAARAYLREDAYARVRFVPTEASR